MTSQHKDGTPVDLGQRASDGGVPSKEAAPRRASRRGRPSADFSARDQIVSGAAEVFGRVGYACASVEDILRAADVSRRKFGWNSYTAKLPVFYRDSSSFAAIDAAPTKAVRPLLRHPSLHPIAPTAFKGTSATEKRFHCPRL